MDLTISGKQGKDILGRDYRKGNWTIQETMVLIKAKKMDDERRMKRSGAGGGADQRAKQAELRWKWVEDYCWKNGCFRSQNQCNDKWDNLMRDFKKVREYERKVEAAGMGEVEDKSYWKMEKNERRENNLPSNMLNQIYEALVDVVDKKDQTVLVAASGGTASSSANVPYAGFAKLSAMDLCQPSMPLPVQQQAPTTMLLQLPPPAEPPNFPFSQPLPTVDSEDTSEYSDSPAKRRKKGDGGSGGEGTSGAAALGEIGTAISKGASIMAKTIQYRDEAEGRRHREALSLHERRLQIEESKAEIKRQGMNNLVEAINKLADSIHALAANNKKNQESFK
ncbi:uncharacterized protein [Primulina huaijiensis]|uniref:uncharacterized protein n=1 Tax=Primulina huaijiensis TaxID=1492673 RepID=UPI003CC76A75